MKISNKENRKVIQLKINYQLFNHKRRHYCYLYNSTYNFTHLDLKQKNTIFHKTDKIFLHLMEYKDYLKDSFIEKMLVLRQGYLTFISKIKLSYSSCNLMKLIFSCTYKIDIDNLILNSKLISELSYSSIFFSKKEIIKLTFKMMMKLFKEKKISLKIAQRKKINYPSESPSVNTYKKKYKFRTYQLENILKKRNLKILKTLKNVKLPIIHTYLAKGNEGNIFFFIISSNRRFSIQQAVKKINRLTKKNRIKIIKTNIHSLTLDTKLFSPILLAIFKKRDLRCSWLIFDSQLISKNILVPGLTKNIFVELKCSSFIYFLSNYVSHITYMNFPQKHF